MTIIVVLIEKKSYKKDILFKLEEGMMILNGGQKVAFEKSVENGYAFGGFSISLFNGSLQSHDEV